VEAKLAKKISRLSTAGKRLLKSRLGRRFPDVFGPRRHQKILDYYEVDSLVVNDGAVPVTWWDNTDNFGDLLSPWLVEQMTGYKSVLADKSAPHYLTIGSIIGRASNSSKVWGSGSFGTESSKKLAQKAEYFAVRGPLTRQKLKNAGIKSPAVYGDPALLAPLYFYPEVPVKYELGVVVRWSEKEWKDAKIDENIKIINLHTSDIEQTLRDFLACKRIISSSLHGLIIADAYGIPNAWRQSETGRGGVFKYYDYFASVNKYREPHQYSIAKKGLALSTLLKSFEFDRRPIEFSYYRLLDACPFLRRKG
jgi:pyruvyltransferase